MNNWILWWHFGKCLRIIALHYATKITIKNFLKKDL